MKKNQKPIMPGEAKRSLQALAILSGRAEPADFLPLRKKQQHEAEIQKNLFEWAYISAGKYPELKLMFHIPNGGRRDIVEAYHLKQQGTKSGVPDICLPVPRSGYHGLYIELKAESGKLRDIQKTWLNELSRQGYKAITAYGFNEARAAIENYLLN